MIDLRDEEVSVECRWGDRQDSATFTAVSALPATDGMTYVIEVCWRDGLVQKIDTIEVRAATLGEALERALRALVVVVGPLKSQWSTGPGL